MSRLFSNYLGGLLGILIMSPLGTKAQLYEQHQFFPTYGASLHHGPRDLSASLAIESSENGIKLFITVEDDKLITTGDAIRQDHVELWISDHRPHTDYYSHEGVLYKLNNEDGWPITGDEKTFVSALNADHSYWGGEDSDTVEVNQVKGVKNFFGMAHWGFYPNGRVELFDRQNYHGISPSPTIVSRIDLVATRTGNGYQMEISFPTEAMIFLSSDKSLNLYFGLDIFDKDQASGKEVTVLSTHKDRKWGATHHFVHINFQPGVTANLAQEMNVVKHFLKEEPFSLYFDGKSWIPVLTEETQGTWWSSIETVRYELNPFVKGHFDYQDQAFEMAAYSSQFNSGSSYTTGSLAVGTFQEDFHSNQLSREEILETMEDAVFTLPDGEIGVMIENDWVHNPYGRGPCAACLIYEVSIYEIGTTVHKKLLSFSFDESYDKPSNLEGVVGAFPANAMIESWEWEEKGRVLKLDVLPVEDGEEPTQEALQVEGTYHIVFRSGNKPLVQKIGELRN